MKPTLDIVRYSSLARVAIIIIIITIILLLLFFYHHYYYYHCVYYHCDQMFVVSIVAITSTARIILVLP